jgi:cytochrome c biogenesis protein CcmG/thiol:disulfide interchange protein DsbE
MGTSDTFEIEETRRGLSPAWLAAGAVALLVLGLLGYALVTGPSQPPQVGSPVPDFQLTALDGSPMKLADYRGEVVVLNFFASWCAPCREEAAELEQTWRDHQDGGVQFLGIAYQDAASKAQAFLAEFDVSYPSAIDPGDRTARAYGVTGVPETFVLDQQGQLVRHFVGPITQAQLQKELAPLTGP